MNFNKKIAIINGSSYDKPFFKIAKELKLEFGYSWADFLKNPREYAMLVLTGGEDVSPQLYGASKHRTTGNSLERDMVELACVQVAYRYSMPMAGICRGSQFLCAFAGGQIVQDVSGHVGGHHRITVNIPGKPEREVYVTSSHHQMQYPFDLPATDYKVIGYSSEPRSVHYAFSAEKIITAKEADPLLRQEPDIVWYPKIRALAAQYHPEWMSESSEGFKLYEELVDLYLKPIVKARMPLAKQA